MTATFQILLAMKQGPPSPFHSAQASATGSGAANAVGTSVSSSGIANAAGTGAANAAGQSFGITAVTASASGAGSSSVVGQAITPVTLTFLTSALATPGDVSTSQSFSVNLGSGGNLVIVAHGGTTEVGGVITSLTVAGSNATKRVAGERDFESTSIWTISGAPSGTQTITVTYAIAISACVIGVYSISGHSSLTPAQTATDITSSAGMAATLNVVAGNAVVG